MPASRPAVSETVSTRQRPHVQTRTPLTRLGRPAPPTADLQFPCPLCPSSEAHVGTAPTVAAHQREAQPGEGKYLLQKLGGPLKKTPRSNRYGVCSKFGDLHNNLTRHSSACNRTPTATVPSHRNEQADGNSIRGPTVTPAPIDTANHLLMLWGIEYVGPVLDVPDCMSPTTMSLTTSKTIRQAHRMPFARCLVHAIRLFR